MTLLVVSQVFDKINRISALKIVRHLISPAGQPFGIAGLLALILVLGACAGPEEEPAVTAVPTESPTRPAATLPLPTATAAIEASMETATEVATATLETMVEDVPLTPLQAELGLPAGTSIALRQTGGYAGVDNLWVFYPDGAIDTPAGEQVTVTPNEVADQVMALDAAGFFEIVPPKSKPICCDHFNYTLYAQDGANENVINVSWGDPDLSPELKEIILALQTMATRDGAS